MKAEKIKPTEKMWRTLVRVVEKQDNCVYLIVPAFSATKDIWCPRQAIPPYIFENMCMDFRIYVHCNIGAENPEDLCFDKWEEVECVCECDFAADRICPIHGRRNKNLPAWS